MAKTYKVTGGVRAGNAMMGTLLRMGFGAKQMRLLTVRGRKSGKPRTTPVTLVENAQGSWLVAPYGTVNWVRNARAAGEVTLQRGREVRRARVEELPADAAAPVLKEYVGRYRIARPYFDVAPDAPIEAYVAEAPRHPVFKLTDAGPQPPNAG